MDGWMDGLRFPPAAISAVRRCCLTTRRVLRRCWRASTGGLLVARPSLIPLLRIQFTRAGIEWRRCHHGARMARPHEEPRHLGRACA